ncbi:MAG: superoxide dismutase family protein [Campylobacter sp.]|nr:superoxide dismutase family protein [Campylobacter sp.]
MKKFLLLGFAFLGLSFASEANFDPKSVEHTVIKVDVLGENANTPAGEIVAIKTDYGVAFFPNLSGLEPGIHGFHIHQNADCGATDKGLGMKAGGHWDPNETGKHSFAWDDSGHKGDLPALYVDSEGNANYPVLAPKIKSLGELVGHSIMIHFGGDNHHDNPKPLGGGGARMACGVIK